MYFKILFLRFSFKASHVSSIKHRIRDEIASELEIPISHHSTGFHPISRNGNTFNSPHRGPRKRGADYFSPWTSWTPCDTTCKQKRERYCIRKKKCGETKHVEERVCPKTL